MTASDKIDVPLSVANNTPERRDVQVVLRTHANLKLIDGKENAHFAVDGGKTARPLYRFQPTIKEGEATLEFTGQNRAVRLRRRPRQVPHGARRLPHRRVS